MIYIKLFEDFENDDSDIIKWKEKIFGKNSELENQYIEKIYNGMNCGVESVENMWKWVVIFGCSLERIFGRKGDLALEFKWRITEGENPKDVSLDLYNKLSDDVKNNEKQLKEILDDICGKIIN